MKISVLGCGRWGSFLAWYFNRIGYDVILWGRESSYKLSSLKNERKNSYVELPDTVKITSSLKQALTLSEDIVIAIDEQNLRALMNNILKSGYRQNNIILSMKGLESKTGKRLSEVVNEFLPETSKVAILCGPGHPSELVQEIPTCMLVDSTTEILKNRIAKEFRSELIQFQIGSDLIGNEIGAAVKNVIGIAAGILDGMGFSSLKGILMVVGIREIAELICDVGGNASSAYGLSCLGDFQSSLFSEHSNSVSYGKAIAQNQKFDKHVPGIGTAHAITMLIEHHDLQLPLLYQLGRILNHETDCRSIINFLIT